MGFVEVVSKQLKKLMTFTRKTNKVVQIDVDLSRQLAYALVEVTDGKDIRSLVQIYDMNKNISIFQKIIVIEQNEIIRRYSFKYIIFRNILVVDSQAFNFCYIKALMKTEVDCHLLIVTINGYQIMISLNELDDNINQNDGDQGYNRLSGSFEIRSCVKSGSTFQHVPYGVMADEQSWNFKQTDTIQIDQQYLDGVYADDGILIMQKSDKIFCSYPDQGQLKFQNLLNTIL